MFVKRIRDARRLSAEAETLRAFGPDRAVRVLEVRADACELVLERVVPGSPLAPLATEDEAMQVVAGLLTHGGWPSAQPAAAESLAVFARALDTSGRPVARAAALLGELAGDERDAALLHGDLHYGNILSSDRAGWLLVDPAGVVGPPAFDIGYLVSRPMPATRDRLPLCRAIDRRLSFLADALQLDRPRVGAYAYVAAALSFAWALEDGDESRDAFAEAMDILERWSR